MSTGPARSSSAACFPRCRAGFGRTRQAIPQAGMTRSSHRKGAHDRGHIQEQMPRMVPQQVLPHRVQRVDVARCSVERGLGLVDPEHWIGAVQGEGRYRRPDDQGRVRASVDELDDLLRDVGVPGESSRLLRTESAPSCAAPDQMSRAHRQRQERLAGVDHNKLFPACETGPTS